ncbi:rhodanese-related sulfurtransferase [Aliifodinibius sp. S!AR15-10]|uniref:oxygen-dependent tRNA uridine(34) hydroxylase TrhO n=1 Tax=Aliifodinibius sp. S!AR15-10 TaxID=2950437 RepID=UPI0028610463|nr:rhodanese-related sulfurtransferase [Aliifodinibius sp. S!AR15-10]MDR8394154.1 rhodanese-related sulfurtransferase [Aliifodinibius sp. S!AR15-10]
MYEVILYYKFTDIEDPESFCEQHKSFCKELGVKGRIYIGREGINGTLGGTPEQMQKYKEHLTAIEGFEGIDFKTDTIDFIPFAKLKCKTRDEIVALHEEDVDPAYGGKYLEPHEWKAVMESGEDYVMIDVRNDYESKIGHFEGAITPDVENFYDFPDWLDQFDAPKDKKVLMYCTGGIRCEKFSVLMKEKGWEDVNQLHGGILRYANEEGGEHYKGKCFVFDDRLVVPVNKDNLEPIARCEITGKPADSYINCANMECNKLFVCSKEGAIKMEGCCSEECRQSEFKRPFDPENAFRPFRKWYNYFDDEFKERELEGNA